jgi:dipeptidyl aminopeptidase/acylaminoacyl peptidase
MLRSTPLLLLACTLAAQSPAPLTVDFIMRGPNLYGYEPQGVRWSGDSSKIFFQWKQWNDPPATPLDTYVVNRDGSGLRKLTEDEAKQAPPAGGDTNRERTMTVFADNGDLALYDHRSGARRLLTRTSDIESNPRFLRDGKRVSFVRNNNLFVLSLDTPLIVQVTDIRPAGSPPPEPKKGTDSQEFIKKEELTLLEIVKTRDQLRSDAEARRKRENPRKPYILAPRQVIAGLQLSPDEKYVMALVVDQPADAKNTLVPNYVSQSAYTEDLPARVKAGELQGRTRLAVVTADSGEWKWVEFTVPGEKAAEAPKSTDSKPGDKKDAPKPREFTFSQLPLWNDAGTHAVVNVRANDHKDRWTVRLDPASAKTTVIFTEHDDAWVLDGFAGRQAASMGWLPNDREIYLLSERSGFSHLYAVPVEGGDARPLTQGRFEVSSPQLSHDQSTLYFASNEVSPHQRHFYSMPAAGGPRTKLTGPVGGHNVTLSRDEKWMVDLFSYTNRPPELYVQETRPGAEAKKLTDSPSPDFQKRQWLDAPIVTFAGRDGVKVPARLYKPANFRPGGPAVIFVHGAGYLQNVHQWWSSYSREYLFHHLLMERGYLVLDVDYRASAGYGRDWRTAIYRYMGGKDLDDQVDAAQWLIATQGVGEKRIGIYGGSYGGFITLMAMFTHPGVFSAGAALRPVTDWAHYNHPYTSNILNNPQADAEAYRRSSPIYHAAGLAGALLICHGMVDVNVHFQDSVRLAQKLIELRKENWELAVYPVEDHGFTEASSWADEYKRILKLFETNLRR